MLKNSPAEKTVFKPHSNMHLIKFTHWRRLFQLLENKIKSVESNYKQQVLLMESHGTLYNFVFINPPPDLNPEEDHDKTARRPIQMCGISAGRATFIALRRSYPLLKRRKPGTAQPTNPDFIIAFLCWGDKESV